MPLCGDIRLAGCVGNSCVGAGGAMPPGLLERLSAIVSGNHSMNAEPYLLIALGLQSPASGVAKPGVGVAKMSGLASSVPGDCAI
jgi:hypothetical protein